MQRGLQNEEQVKPIYFICICIKAIQIIKREFQYFIFIKIRMSKINFYCHGFSLHKSRFVCPLKSKSFNPRRQFIMPDTVFEDFSIQQLCAFATRHNAKLIQPKEDSSILSG